MATNIYMNISGIPGNSTSSAYPNQFEVLSLNFEISPSSGAQLTPVTATIHDYNLPRLFSATATGKHFPTVVFSIVGYDATGTEFLVESITLQTAFISQLQYSASGDVPILDLAFSYARIEITEPG